MAKVKTEHYVPKSYLRRFVDKEGFIFVFDKFTRKVFKSSIENVACENYFYDLPEESDAEVDVDPQIVEKALSDIESAFSCTIEALLQVMNSSREKVIQKRQRAALAYFITMQQLRTRETRNLFIEMRQKLGEELLSRSNMSSDEYCIEVNTTEAALSQSALMFNSQVLNLHISVLCNHLWFVGINDTGYPFYASDAPVVRKGHYGEAGLASKGIEIAFPLSSKYILIICDRTAFAHYANLDCKSMILNADNVTYYNSLQIAGCHRQAFCSSNSFELAREICDEYPQLCSPSRPKVQLV